MRSDFVETGRVDRGRGLTYRNVVHIPAVGGTGGVCADPEPDQDLVRIGIGRQTVPALQPAGGGTDGIGSQLSPSSTHIARHFRFAIVTAKENTPMPVGQHGEATAQQVAPATGSDCKLQIEFDMDLAR